MVLLKRISTIHKAVAVAVSFSAVAFGSLSSAEAQCVGSPAQCRNCLLAGQPILFFPGDPGPEARSLDGVLYTETGPFLSAPGAATNLSAQMNMNPPAPAGSQLLGAAMLETMGYCEGPITFSQVGDGGTATTNFGPCGSITDTFTVVSDGTGSTPYQIRHNLSGNLTLQNLPPLGPEIESSRKHHDRTDERERRGESVLRVDGALCRDLHGELQHTRDRSSPVAVRDPDSVDVVHRREQYGVGNCRPATACLWADKHHAGLGPDGGRHGRQPLRARHLYDPRRDPGRRRGQQPCMRRFRHLPGAGFPSARDHSGSRCGQG